MGNNTWTNKRKMLGLQQAIAALEWNIKDCTEIIHECGDMLNREENDTLWERWVQAESDLASAKARLAELEAKENDHE